MTSIGSISGTLRSSGFSATLTSVQPGYEPINFRFEFSGNLKEEPPPKLNVSILDAFVGGLHNEPLVFFSSGTTNSIPLFESPLVDSALQGGEEVSGPSARAGRHSGGRQRDLE